MIMQIVLLTRVASREATGLCIINSNPFRTDRSPVLGTKHLELEEFVP